MIGKEESTNQTENKYKQEKRGFVADKKGKNRQTLSFSQSHPHPPITTVYLGLTIGVNPLFFYIYDGFPNT